MSLPTGFRVRLAGGVIRQPRDRLLVGGSPLSVMRMSEQADDLLAGDALTVADPATAHLAERLLATNLGVPDLDGVPLASADELTVVIPIRDRPEQLDRALAPLAPLHTIVVDDESRDPGAVARVARRHGAEVLPLAVNVGPAAARNAGLALVTSPYVAFVDSDVQVDAADLLRLTRHFADSSVALVGPRVAAVPRSARPRWFERYDALASSLTLGRTPASVGPGAAVAWLPGACLVARTAALRDGFDADLRVGEDVDLVWRLVEAGHRVRYDPLVDARHDARPTVRGWLGRKFVYGSGGAGLAARHGDVLAPAVLSPTYAAAALALLLRRRWSVPVAAVALTVGTRSVRSTLPTGVHGNLLAARLASRGLAWAVRQESALLLRHWWPAAALGAMVSGRVRRAVLSALAVDALVLAAEQRDAAHGLNPVALLAGRRLDDLAYGAGLWWGALRAGSARVLVPRRPGRRDARRGAAPRSGAAQV